MVLHPSYINIVNLAKSIHRDTKSLQILGSFSIYLHQLFSMNEYEYSIKREYPTETFHKLALSWPKEFNQVYKSSWEFHIIESSLVFVLLIRHFLAGQKSKLLVYETNCTWIKYYFTLKVYMTDFFLFA